MTGRTTTAPSATPCRVSKGQPATPLRARMLRCVDALLAAIERVQDALMLPPAPPDDRDGLQRAVGRRTNDRMALWQMCGRTRCAHARRCRGAPHACLMRHAPRLQPDLVARARALLQRDLNDARRAAILPPAGKSADA